MMPTLIEGRLQFSFPKSWEVTKYDEWGHFKNQAIKLCGGARAIDMILMTPGSECWLVEVKDYRNHPRTKAIDLPEEVAYKVRDTLAALVGAQHHATDPKEKSHAKRFVRASSIRVVLHLEQTKKHSKLFPRAISAACVQQRLKQLLKPIDPHPKVVDLTSLDRVPWHVESN